MVARSETSCDSKLDAVAHGGEQSPSVLDAPQDGGSGPHTPAHQTPEVRSFLASELCQRRLNKAMSSTAISLSTTAQDL